jgi:hypothetical protein
LEKYDQIAPDKQITLPLESPEGELGMGDPTEPKSNFCSSLLNRVLERKNLVRALKQVRRNKGAPGIDGMTVDELPEFLKQHWPHIRQQLIVGTYRPKPVKRVEIPKPVDLHPILIQIRRIFAHFFVPVYHRYLAVDQMLTV